MGVREAGEAALTFFKDIISKPASIIGVEKTEKGWKALVEAVDHPEGGFDPVLGLYEVTLDEKLTVTAYERKSLRRRSELEWHAPTPV